MSEVPLSAPDSDSAPAQLGRQLAAAREQSGFSVADVARQLKLTPWQVDAMEAGDYQRLPGPVFVRGFIRNYARLLKLDPTPHLLSGAERPFPVTGAPEAALPYSVDIPFPNGRTFKWHRYAMVALLALAVLVAYEYYRDDVGESTLKSRQVDLPPQVVTEERPAQTPLVPQPAIADDAAAQPARDSSGAADAEKTALEKDVLGAPAARTEPSPGERLVRLRFERESWVEIRDRDGRKILSRLNPAGTEQAVSGQPPLTLVVGNAAGVRLMLNDQQVDLAPYIKVDVARLTLE